MTDNTSGSPVSETERLWSDEIARRIADIREARVEMMSEEEVRRRLAQRLVDGHFRRESPG